ncbi:hypothetical protein DERP_003408 [Dermatophagoides pteronyssinus]|uniref:Uncharacterized protein n=1 Tax=Dermatophagoides pteronyssinus TaxID=6956 RepID=A0ABQ8JJF3_DERPT|nr:hypothetical protein DERP_003408 [Dermatophagoides pteronyssinus]
MSSNSSNRPIGFAIDDIDSSQQQQQQQPRPNIRLTWIDRIWRFFYSKEEFEAYLIEKELKRQKKREQKLARQQAQMQN